MNVGPPLLAARKLTKLFPVKTGPLTRTARAVRAVDGIGLDLTRGESYALVGESGCGKTTLGRTLIRLIEPTSGEIRFAGEDLLALSPRELRRRRRHFQMVFQDPYGSLNPRLSVAEALGEPLLVHGLARRSEVRDHVEVLLDRVGLTPAAATRYPHEFSGGERQRIGIARALATEPQLLIADEPVSALDVSIQAQIVNLLAYLQVELGLTLLFIGHDLAVVEQLADRVSVMYLGQIVEEGETSSLFRHPQHPYTVSLLSAIPVPDPTGSRTPIFLPGDPPDPAEPPPGCRFHTRCPIAQDRCRGEAPELAPVAGGLRVACHFPGEMDQNVRS